MSVSDLGLQSSVTLGGTVMPSSSEDAQNEVSILQLRTLVPTRKDLRKDVAESFKDLLCSE